LPAYSQRHLDAAAAVAYRGKFERSLLRRLSHWRESQCVRAMARRAIAGCTPADHGPRLLDVPCGAGRFAPLLAGLGGSYLAADHSPAMLLLCRQRLQAAGLGARAVAFVQADARKLPLPDRSVDLACCLRLLHHFPERRDRLAILAELARVCHGPLVLSFLDAAAHKQRLYLWRRRRRGQLPRRVLLSRAELAAEAQAAGWRLLRTAGISSWFSGQTVALLLPHDR